jgi:hypothetical protein
MSASDLLRVIKEYVSHARLISAATEERRAPKICTAKPMELTVSNMTASA